MPDAASTNVLRLALPGKGKLGNTAMEFLARAGLRVYRPNERQYIATIPAIPAIEVIFQRVTDIVGKVNNGSVDIGITGYDVLKEYSDENDDIILIQKLGFGECQLVLAIPNSWIDITSFSDLADLSLEYKSKGRMLRIVTKYPNLTRNWFHQKGLTNFKLVNGEGALEVAPTMGYADMIVDITQTGTTLRENRLKVIEGGTILSSEACLIGNVKTLADEKLQVARQLLEYIEAHVRAREYVFVVANIPGESEAAVGKMIAEQTQITGLVGPGIAPILSSANKLTRWYEVNVVVQKKNLIETMDDLRTIGGKGITVTHPAYVFEEDSRIYRKLEEKLNHLRKS